DLPAFAFADFLAACFAAGLFAFFVFLAILFVFLATAFLARFFAAAAVVVFALFFFEDFVFLATTNSFVACNWGVLETIRLFSASLPRAAKTPKKPEVSARDCSLRYRVPRGRSFPIPPPGVQGAAGSHWRWDRYAGARSPSARRRR